MSADAQHVVLQGSINLLSDTVVLMVLQYQKSTFGGLSSEAFNGWWTFFKLGLPCESILLMISISCLPHSTSCFPSWLGLQVQAWQTLPCKMTEPSAPAYHLKCHSQQSFYSILHQAFLLMACFLHSCCPRSAQDVRGLFSCTWYDHVGMYGVASRACSYLWGMTAAGFACKLLMLCWCSSSHAQ